ncbi:stage III sporulation protein AC [Tumebacillus sp. BK434]|uniref:Stage III sporulation protein AC n=1 Tax=Tumebacillus avium TaxID=1903704 RepID=A0A1Y0IPI8_9BACL|nr:MULTISPECIES: stage III sporulation protein AC [Tumebacillus]ARU62210.1 stage III sporulation protein AC [Tumebacillus avium]TCP52838.1 stage III sporulation protein AC [Tumebacillus sp. BK434]
MNSDVNTIFFIAGIGILTAVIHTVLKQSGKEEFAHWATLTGFIVIMLTVITYISDLFDKVRNVFLMN